MKQQAGFRPETKPQELPIPAPRVRTGEPDPWNGKARKAAAAPQTLTSRMLDYRSWWNLPGPKARKTHG